MRFTSLLIIIILAHSCSDNNFVDLGDSHLNEQLLKDSDGDGIFDYIEREQGLDPYRADIDFSKLELTQLQLFNKDRSHSYPINLDDQPLKQQSLQYRFLLKKSAKRSSLPAIPFIFPFIFPILDEQSHEVHIHQYNPFALNALHLQVSTRDQTPLSLAFLSRHRNVSRQDLLKATQQKNQQLLQTNETSILSSIKDHHLDLYGIDQQGIESFYKLNIEKKCYLLIIADEKKIDFHYISSKKPLAKALDDYAPDRSFQLKNSTFWGHHTWKRLSEKPDPFKSSPKAGEVVAFIKVNEEKVQKIYQVPRLVHQERFFANDLIFHSPPLPKRSWIKRPIDRVYFFAPLGCQNNFASDHCTTAHWQHDRKNFIDFFSLTSNKGWITEPSNFTQPSMGQFSYLQTNLQPQLSLVFEGVTSLYQHAIESMEFYFFELLPFEQKDVSIPRMDICAATANIRFENPEDAQHSWALRRELMAEVLRYHHPDVIGTQEGWEPQLRDLEQLLPEHEIIDRNRPWLDHRMYPCLYIKKSKFDVLDSGDKWLSNTPDIPDSSDFDSAFPRLMTWAILQDKHSAKKFFIANAHLDHVKEKTRIEQAEVMYQQITQINSAPLPCIVCGDFNSAPQEAVHQIFSQLKDPWIDKAYPDQSTYHFFNGSHPEGQRIDWILHSEDFICEDIVIDKTHHHNLYPSDHFPVVGRFKLLS